VSALARTGHVPRCDPMNELMPMTRKANKYGTSWLEKTILEIIAYSVSSNLPFY